MKLTTEKIKQIIKEELTKILEGKEEDEMMKDMFLYGPGAGLAMNRFRKMQKNKLAADEKKRMQNNKRLQRKPEPPSQPLPSPEELGDFQTGIEMDPSYAPASSGSEMAVKSGKPMKLGALAAGLRDMGLNATAEGQNVSVMVGGQEFTFNYGDYATPEEFIDYLRANKPEVLPMHLRNVGGTVDVQDPMMESIKRKWSKLV